MTVYVQADTDYNYKIDFLVNGELVHPSAATITLTGNDGTVVDGIDDEAVTVGATATSAVYTLPDTANDLDEAYPLRYITVKFTYDSKDYVIEDYYVLRASLKIPVTKNEVRAFAGFASSELSDDAIDLYVALSQLQSDLTDANVENLIASGSILIPHIQIALKAKAALNGLTLVELNLFQSEQADNTLYKRFQSVDFKDALGRLQEAYDRALAAIDGVTESAPITYSVIATPTDPVTGA